MSLTLDECHDGLPLTHIEMMSLFLDFFSYNYLHGFVHYPLAFAKHDHVVDNLRMRLPIFRQIERLPSEMIQFVVLHRQR